jgi:large subunit ribosomal protein L15
MKLHDLRPADGAHRPKTRVGRGIAAGKGKTAGRGTKGQKARAGGSVPPWFEGGQTPLHMRIPKLRGFKNRAKIDYEIVNVGDIDARVEAGAFAKAGTAPKKGEQLTINADILRAVGLVRDVRKPLKVLGGGELSTALFVVADAFTKSATAKIEGAGGAVSVLEVPAVSRPALGVGDEEGARAAREPRTEAGRAAASRKADARAARAADAAERASEAAAVAERPAKAAKGGNSASATEVRADAQAADDGPAKPAPKARSGARAPKPAADEADSQPVAADAGADVTDPVEAAPADEPADAPDAVADATGVTPVSGDDTESDPVPGDDA